MDPTTGNADKDGTTPLEGCARGASHKRGDTADGIFHSTGGCSETGLPKREHGQNSHDDGTGNRTNGGRPTALITLTGTGPPVSNRRTTARILAPK